VGYATSKIEEVFDEGLEERLPPQLRPSSGFQRTVQYGAGPPAVVDLTGSLLAVSYRVDCAGSGWRFVGTVGMVPDEGGEPRNLLLPGVWGGRWEARPDPDRSENPDAGKAALESFFFRNWPRVPYRTEDDSDTGGPLVAEGISFYECVPVDNETRLTSPEATWYDMPGRALASWDCDADALLEAGRWGPRRVVGADSLPVLKRRPIFVERFEFVPDEESPDTGRLAKDVVPGWLVWASSIPRPRFEVRCGEGPQWTVTKESKGRSSWWRIDVDVDIVVKAVNPAPLRAGFEDVEVVPANLFRAVAAASRYGIIEPAWWRVSSGQSPAVAEFSGVLESGESRVVFEAHPLRFTVVVDDEVEEGGKKRSVPEDEIKKLVKEQMLPLLDGWRGEAALIGGRFVMEPESAPAWAVPFTLNAAFA
jgi:hypothetical protein